MISRYNGQEAVTLYQETGFKDIDMILMDKDMPVMTGETATEKLVEMGCQTPIVALTSCTKSLDEFIMRGAMGVLNKPLQIPNLLQTLLRTRSMRVGAQQQRAALAKPEPDQALKAASDVEMVRFGPIVM